MEMYEGSAASWTGIDYFIDPLLRPPSSTAVPPHMFLSFKDSPSSFGELLPDSLIQ